MTRCFQRQIFTTPMRLLGAPPSLSQLGVPRGEGTGEKTPRRLGRATTAAVGLISASPRQTAFREADRPLAVAGGRKVKEMRRADSTSETGLLLDRNYIGNSLWSTAKQAQRTLAVDILFLFKYILDEYRQ